MKFEVKEADESSLTYTLGELMEIWDKVPSEEQTSGNIKNMIKALEPKIKACGPKGTQWGVQFYTGIVADPYPQNWQEFMMRVFNTYEKFSECIVEYNQLESGSVSKSMRAGQESPISVSDDEEEMNTDDENSEKREREDENTDDDENAEKREREDENTDDENEINQKKPRISWEEYKRNLYCEGCGNSGHLETDCGFHRHPQYNHEWKIHRLPFKKTKTYRILEVNPRNRKNALSKYFYADGTPLSPEKIITDEEVPLPRVVNIKN